MRILIVNGGDRPVHPGGLSTEQAQPGTAWASELATALNLPLVDFSRQGRASEEIVRTTIEGVQKCIERGITPSNMLVVIQWSGRTSAEVLTDQGFARVDPSRAESAKDGPLYRNLEAVLALQSFLLARGIAFFFLCRESVPGLERDPRKSAPERFAYLTRAIDWNRFVWDGPEVCRLDSWALRQGQSLTLQDDLGSEHGKAITEELLLPWVARHLPSFARKRSKEPARPVGV